MGIQLKTIENDLEYLRQKSKTIDLLNMDYRRLIHQLDDYCSKKGNLLALASVQIGIPYRMIYFKKMDLEHIDDESYNQRKIMINPIITKKEGLTKYWEACASCQNNTALVLRPYRIKIEYYDEDQIFHKDDFQGFPATIISHEMDHLDGVLHMDQAIKLKILDVNERMKLREREPYCILKKAGNFEQLKAKWILK